MSEASTPTLLPEGARRRRTVNARLLQGLLLLARAGLPFGPALALPGSASAAADAAADAREILHKADGYRNFRGRPFSFDLTLRSVEPGEPERTFRMRAKILDAHTSLIVYAEPASERGKALLTEGANLWFHAPASSRPIRITPQQRLLGEASNGDVASTDFSGDYEPVLAGRERVDGVSTHKLELTAKPGSLAAYAKVHLWVDATTGAPVKADFLTEAGKRLKTAYYRRFETLAAAGSKPQLVEVEIVNAVSAEKRTLMQYANFSLAPLPASDFSPSALQRIR